MNLVHLERLHFSLLRQGASVFGSGLAIVPFLHGGVVNEYHWLSEHEFIDAVSVAMITPEPVVITVVFIGYLVAGFPEACVAALATFLPCYLFTVLPALYFKKYGRHPSMKAFVDDITAAVVGALAAPAIVIAIRTIKDIPTALIELITIVILLRIKKVKEPQIIFAAAVIGLVLKLLIYYRSAFHPKTYLCLSLWQSNASYHPFYFVHLQYCLHTV